MALYKRVYNTLKEDGTLLMVSDNKMYPPYQIAPQEVLEIWEFSALIDLEERNEKEITLEQLMTKLQSMESQISDLRGN